MSRPRSEDEAEEFFLRIGEEQAARREASADAKAADSVYRVSDETVASADRLWGRLGRQR